MSTIRKANISGRTTGATDSAGGRAGRRLNCEQLEKRLVLSATVSQLETAEPVDLFNVAERSFRENFVESSHLGGVLPSQVSGATEFGQPVDFWEFSGFAEARSTGSLTPGTSAIETLEALDRERRADDFFTVFEQPLVSSRVFTAEPLSSDSPQHDNYRTNEGLASGWFASDLSPQFAFTHVAVAHVTVAQVAVDGAVDGAAASEFASWTGAASRPLSLDLSIEKDLITEEVGYLDFEFERTNQQLGGVVLAADAQLLVFSSQGIEESFIEFVLPAREPTKLAGQASLFALPALVNDATEVVPSAFAAETTYRQPTRNNQDRRIGREVSGPLGDSAPASSRTFYQASVPPQTSVDDFGDPLSPDESSSRLPVRLGPRERISANEASDPSSFGTNSRMKIYREVQNLLDQLHSPTDHLDRGTSESQGMSGSLPNSQPLEAGGMVALREVSSANSTDLLIVDQAFAEDDLFAVAARTTPMLGAYRAFDQGERGSSSHTEQKIPWDAHPTTPEMTLRDFEDVQQRQEESGLTHASISAFASFTITSCLFASRRKRQEQ